MQEHYVKTIHNSGLSFTSSIGDHAVPIDASAEHGGQNSGASPKKLMLASLAGCTGIDVVMLLDKMKAVYSDFSIDISASLTDEHPKIYKDVVVSYRIRIDEKDRAKMEKAVQLSQDKYCGVSAMFKAFANVTHQIIYT